MMVFELKELHLPFSNPFLFMVDENPISCWLQKVMLTLEVLEKRQCLTCQ